MASESIGACLMLSAVGMQNWVTSLAVFHKAGLISLLLTHLSLIRAYTATEYVEINLNYSYSFKKGSILGIWFLNNIYK